MGFIATYGLLNTPRALRMNTPASVPVEKMRQILTEVIDIIESPQYASKLDEAKEAAGNEMLKMMQMVFPAIIQIEIEVIKRHGFSSAREGIVHFTQMVRQMETQDSEIARLHAQIRSHYMPPVSISSTVDTSL
ncbi:protein C10 [Trichoplusia ni]|uniref:Protein C10 n=1 Tax=Trichoplusia ni TaxID=7111 RepID=A0A7E5VAT1_TRINI|nr:protein C10 [Trichoplusia ni]XP_026725392.1 protein C10 [Trichoplusia ni]